MLMRQSAAVRVSQSRLANALRRVASPFDNSATSVLLQPAPGSKDSRLEGDVIFTQKNPSAHTQCIGSIRGISPGLHGLAILEVSMRTRRLSSEQLCSERQAACSCRDACRLHLPLAPLRAAT